LVDRQITFPTDTADISWSFKRRERSRSFMSAFQISGLDHDGFKVARRFSRLHGRCHVALKGESLTKGTSKAYDCQ
jgi:hypothetical protein